MAGFLLKSVTAGDKVSNALRSLEGNTSFTTIVEWLHESHAELVKHSETLIEVPMYRNQGARALLSEFDKALELNTRPRPR